jgi:hypothetical protein
VEPAIRQALAAVGATIVQVSSPGAPDLLVTYQGRLYAAEVKSGTGKLTPAQVRLGAGEHWPIWRSVDDALRAIGALR